MNTDVSRNMVVFVLKQKRKEQQAISYGPTRADDCVQQAWSKVQRENGAATKHVTALHSEWEPSPDDIAFIRKNFPKARFTYNFSRPGPQGWDAAFAAARQTIEESAAAHAKQKMDQISEHGELLPVLWSGSSPKRDMLQYLPHHALVPERLFVALATVAPTPQGTIGMNHVGHSGLEGRPFDDLMGEASNNLAHSLRIEGRSDPDHPEKGQLIVVQRTGPCAASALALPDFHGRISALIGQDQLTVGVPEPDTVVVTAAGSGWEEDVEQAVLRSPCPPSEMVPTVLSMTSGGVQILAERQ
jgi:hypothetical protein